MKRTHPMKLRVMACLSVALALNCGDALGPEDIAGTYALQQVGGDHLPAVFYTTPTAIVRVLADTLRFTADRRGTSTTVTEREPVAGGPVTGPLRGETSFGFRIVEGRIEVAFDCPIDADCVAPPHMVLKRTGTGLEGVFAFARTPLLYSRVVVSP
jgi:hypothetical protein